LLRRAGREIHVEKIDAIYNFTEWFATLGLEMSGIASTHFEPEANHCWRIVRRGDLPGYVDCCTENVGWDITIIEDCKP
jgi:hypothetical protein